MPHDDPPGDAAIGAAVRTLGAATDALERLSPVALAALARAASRFTRGAKQLRRRRSRRVRPMRVPPRRAATVADPPRPSARAPRRPCYACGARYTARHFFYDSLCPTCAPLHYAKRSQTADLRGKIALVTGARVTSGHAIALKLVRAGATVIGTTRFPRDAAARFATEPDFAAWRDRLHLHGLDFRAAGWVEAFAAHVDRSFRGLHILVNNAAQTVRRPAPFYAHLVEGECATEVAAALRPLLASDAALAADGGPGLAARMSQAQVLPEDARALPGSRADALDLRDRNTWTLGMGEVASAECLETLLVNAAAPFILTGRLRALMNRDPLAAKWIVNVTAVEGQFARAQKSGRHPHLDMAKAALNMLTRSAADDYARDRIYMNSVDVGWFSSGEPAPVIAAMQAQGFALPLDVVDAASRACDPIFTGVATGANVHGKLLKNYQPVAW